MRIGYSVVVYKNILPTRMDSHIFIRPKQKNRLVSGRQPLKMETRSAGMKLFWILVFWFLNRCGIDGQEHLHMYIVHISWQGSMSKLTDSLFLYSMWCIPVFVHPEKSSKQFECFQLRYSSSYRPRRFSSRQLRISATL